MWVEVMGRYLNHSDQGECLRNLLEMVPSGSKTAKTRTPRRVCRRLDPTRVEDLIRGYADGIPVDDLATQFGGRPKHRPETRPAPRPTSPVTKTGPKPGQGSRSALPR